MIFAFVYKSPFWAIYPALASEMAVIFVLFGGGGVLEQQASILFGCNFHRYFPYFGPMDSLRAEPSWSMKIRRKWLRRGNEETRKDPR